jgi:hypothetical protein
MIRATTDSEKSNITLHVCHCDQSVTVNGALRELIQGIEKIAQLKLRRQKQFSLRIIIRAFSIPYSIWRRPCAGATKPLKGFRLSPE